MAAPVVELELKPENVRDTVDQDEVVDDVPIPGEFPGRPNHFGDAEAVPQPDIWTAPLARGN